MTKLKTICFAVTTAALAGCAVMPRHYDDESSRALNLARAGGVYDQDLRDSPDGTRSYRKGLLVSALNLASLTTSLDAPLRHLTGTQTLLFNATDIMMTPEIDGHPLMLWSVKAERYGCADSNCIIAYNIQQPNHWKTPSYVIGGEAASYNIAANHPEKYSRLVFRQSGHERTFPVDEFYGAVSAGMPPWIVMYFPPNTVIQDGEPLPYPVLYEQGQQLMFREPDHE